jgi:hypothetical protein
VVTRARRAPCDAFEACGVAVAFTTPYRRFRGDTGSSGAARRLWRVRRCPRRSTPHRRAAALALLVDDSPTPAWAHEGLMLLMTARAREGPAPPLPPPSPCSWTTAPRRRRGPKKGPRRRRGPKKGPRRSRRRRGPKKGPRRSRRRRPRPAGGRQPHADGAGPKRARAARAAAALALLVDDSPTPTARAQKGLAPLAPPPPSPCSWTTAPRRRRGPSKGPRRLRYRRRNSFARADLRARCTRRRPHTRTPSRPRVFHAPRDGFGELRFTLHVFNSARKLNMPLCPCPVFFL